MERSVVKLLCGLLLLFATGQPKTDDWDIYSFHINSTVTSRYATTIITSRVANRMNESKEIEFHVKIPKNAFISKFKMMMDGQVYEGVVKTKEQAQVQYTEAVSRGQSAGIVSSVGRTMEEFKTSVTVAAHKKVTFELTYEELLKRTHGKYKLQIHTRPTRPVQDFKMDVHIREKVDISFVDVKGGLNTKALANAITKTHTNKQAWVYFHPTVDQQKTCDSCGEEGMNGDLVIVYDVNRENGLGDIMTSDGYFVHHFAPSDLPRIPKNVVFIIDQSGSMHGRKMAQTRTALVHILNDLAEDDFFGLISFDSAINYWKRELIQATGQNLEQAKQFVLNIRDRGATDINAAVLEGARMLNVHPREGSASILILLTDGDPTTGVTNINTIRSNVKQKIAGKYPLYCLGFGFDVNFEFLKKMSLENNGVARRIYEDSDADLQLKGFYDEVATPLLTDVTMIYVGGANLTQTNFSQYYNGSEIVVAGEIIDNNVEIFTPQVVAISTRQKVAYSNTNSSVGSLDTKGLLQRVWAYLKVKQLLEKELLLTGSEKNNAKKEALELSLKYSFVTPLTSMVVTKPEGENTEVLYKPKERGNLQPERSTKAHGRVSNSGRPSVGHKSRKLGARIGSFPQSLPVGTLRKGARIASFPLTPQSQSLPVATPRKDISKVMAVQRMKTDSTLLTTSAPVFHRFLMKTVNYTLPLCFDVIGGVNLKLLHHPSTELYINGVFDSTTTNSGFKKIVIHVGADHHIEVDPEGISLRHGQSTTRHTGEDRITVGRFTVTRLSNETEFADVDVRLSILLHRKDGNNFLWPVLRQSPSAGDTVGLLALDQIQYEVVQQNSQAKVKITDTETDVQRSTAFDYRINSPTEVDCWLIAADFVIPMPLREIIVAQL
ncbi:inter-alpha-trypsin inhibitor heavy chain H3 isoform X1 [Fundulus heteroclitus]|nr:inter-alpha-trypsin inhibitor heavy chain H3 isoform X1 [Fundulus heteroclitus]